MNDADIQRSMSWFAKCFTKQFGMRPKDFIRQNQDGKSSG